MTTITQVITALPAAPDPVADAPALFSTKAAASVLAQKGLPTELNAFGAQANSLAVEANTSAALAVAARVAAESAAAAAAAAVGAPLWVTGTTYALPDTRVSPGNGHTFRKKTASSVSSTDPKDDPTNWLDLTASGALQLTGGAMTGDIDMAGHAIKGALIKNCAGATAAAVTNAMDYRDGDLQSWTPAAGVQTLTISNWPAAPNWGAMLLKGVSLGGASTRSLSVSVKWRNADGTFTTSTSFTTNHGATLQSGAGVIDFVALWSDETGQMYGKVGR